eukprot:4121365-Pyramimonas_sp.AAC.1
MLLIEAGAKADVRNAQGARVPIAREEVAYSGGANQSHERRWHIPVARTAAARACQQISRFLSIRRMHGRVLSSAPQPPNRRKQNFPRTD